MIIHCMMIMYPFLHLCRHCIAHLPGRSVLRALLYHGVSGWARCHQLQESCSRSCAVLGLLPRLDSAAVLRVESLRTRGARNHLLGWLDGQDSQQHLLHHLSLYLLSGPPVPRHCLLLRETAARDQTGETSLFASESLKVIQDVASLCTDERVLKWV